MPAARRDPFAGCPETTQFMLLLPSTILDDESLRDQLLDRLKAAFPGSTFSAAPCESLAKPGGGTLVIDEPIAVPMMGSVGAEDRYSPMFRRPPPARMAEINAALLAFINGSASLN
ncbi:hypothetical protein [Methylobacterium sp. PvR107]|uniref:hypothetical protein n=1 Tax=Methylobacterium sp. PvR107 TaxID=2806597 RepID=UPI001AEA0F2C|nr:hypothetical protein [Methylobacterium sp. PvR107]MBP1179989.1 hypothetical protein [Methylobacterium sp. PvR107]